MGFENNKEVENTEQQNIEKAKNNVENQEQLDKKLSDISSNLKPRIIEESNEVNNVKKEQEAPKNNEIKQDGSDSGVEKSKNQDNDSIIIEEKISNIKDSLHPKVSAENEISTKENNSIQEFENKINNYYNKCNEIGESPSLSNVEKVARMQEAYNDLGDGNRTNINCPGDAKYLDSTTDGESWESGRPKYDWPDNLGFDIENDKITPITREDQIPSKIDRYGGMTGSNFAGIPEDDKPYSYDERAIPYLENTDAYHNYDLDNGHYYGAIDAIKNKDVSAMNNIIDDINSNNPGLDIKYVDQDDINEMNVEYNNFLDDSKDIIGNIDATYGLKGTAAPWKDSETNEVYMKGGAEQIVTPINAERLSTLGLLRENMER